jgi:hypothetical protein
MRRKLKSFKMLFMKRGGHRYDTGLTHSLDLIEDFSVRIKARKSDIMCEYKIKCEAS